MSDVVNYYMSAPPIARTVATVVFLASLGVYTGMLSIYGFIFHYSLLLKFPPAIHRFVTSFLITSKDLGVLFDTYFVYTYLSQLERNNSKFVKKEDLIWYLIFVGGTITAPHISARIVKLLLQLSRFLELRKITPALRPSRHSHTSLGAVRSVGMFLNQIWTGAYLYLHALLIALCYTANQDARGMQAHFYIITVPAQLMPWCMLLAQLLFTGWESFQVGLTGILAAHLHDFLTRIYPEFGGGPNLAPTPWFLSWIMSTPRTRPTPYGTSYAPPRSGSERSGPLPDSWRTKGPGRRLG
ncbi:Der1-like family-domain-containing protein [Biscogniauxia mediterranea]|nr:Der1-like family-domain-containing protein [Biscogniauxia mediterranea]